MTIYILRSAGFDMQISHWYRVSFLLPCSAARMRRITLSRFRWSSFVTGLENCGVILRLNWGRLRSRTDAEKGDNVIRMYVHCIYLLLYTIWALSAVTASLTYGAVNQCYEYAWTVPAVYVKDTWPTRQTWVHSILAGPYTQSDPNSNPNIIQSMDRVSPIHVQL